VTIRASIVVALPASQEVVELELPEGSTLRQALDACDIGKRHPEFGPVEAWRVGIWSRPARLDRVLRDGDRVEVYRALKADPKAMRHARVRRATRSRNAP
jgi:putative ubiquitin-RnfH superfamily antitoxin RatB of RatAB toxin-antitoxin module